MYKDILSIGPKPVLKADDRKAEVAEHLEVEKFLAAEFPYPDNTFKEIYAQFVLQRVMDPRPIIAECYRVAQRNGLLEMTVPFGSHDMAWENPHNVRPYFPGTWMQFSRPVQERDDFYPYDFQPKLLIMRIPDGLYAMIPEEQRMQAVMSQRNIAVEMTVVMEAQKVPREAGNPDKIRMPRLLIEPLSGRKAPSPDGKDRFKL